MSLISRIFGERVKQEEVGVGKPTAPVLDLNRIRELPLGLRVRYYASVNPEGIENDKETRDFLQDFSKRKRHTYVIPNVNRFPKEDLEEALVSDVEVILSDPHYSYLSQTIDFARENGIELSERVNPSFTRALNKAIEDNESNNILRLIELGGKIEYPLSEDQIARIQTIYRGLKKRNYMKRFRFAHVLGNEQDKKQVIDRVVSELESDYHNRHYYYDKWYPYETDFIRDFQRLDLPLEQKRDFNKRLFDGVSTTLAWAMISEKEENKRNERKGNVWRNYSEHVFEGYFSPTEIRKATKKKKREIEKELDDEREENLRELVDNEDYQGAIYLAEKLEKKPEEIAGYVQRLLDCSVKEGMDVCEVIRLVSFANEYNVREGLRELGKKAVPYLFTYINFRPHLPYLLETGALTEREVQEQALNKFREEAENPLAKREDLQELVEEGHLRSYEPARDLVSVLDRVYE